MPQTAEKSGRPAAETSAAAGSWVATGIALLGITAFMTAFVLVGADLYWLVALGDTVRDTGGVPEGVPFAEADSTGWHNVVVAAELLLSLLHGLGDWVMPFTQVLMTVGALLVLGVGARLRGASDRAVALTLVVVFLGSLSTFVVVRLQMLSLVPFALLLILLHADARRPGRRIWLLPVLVALWTNLHGAVLLGVCVAGCYLLFSRLRRAFAETVALGVVTLAVLLVTPAGLGTAAYYAGVMTNEAAQRGEGLWAQPTPSNPLDVLMALTLLFAGLALLRVRRELAVWEWVALAGLTVSTALAARNGVWLLMAASIPVAVALTRRPAARAGAGLRWGLPVAVILTVAAAVASLVTLRGEQVLPVEPDLADRIATEAGEDVVLAPAPLVELLVVEGTTVWAGNPIDAFEPAVQRAYLDFVYGGPAAGEAIAEADVVVTEEGTDPHAAMEDVGGFTAMSLGDGWFLHRRS